MTLKRWIAAVLFGLLFAVAIVHCDAATVMTAGTTSHSEYIFVQDSSSTTGAGLTGLVYNTSNLTCYYVRARGSSTSISLATQTVTGAWSSAGFVEVDATHQPGVYRLDVPDAVLASGVTRAVLYLRGATNMAPVVLEYQLVAWDINTALSSQTVSAVSGAVGSVTGDVGGKVVGAVGSVTGDVGGKVVGAVASVTGDVGGKVTGSVGSLADKGASLTSVGDTRLANLDATVSSRSTYAGGAVASVTGDVGGKVTGSVGSLADKGASLTSVGDTRLANLDAAVSSRSTYAGGAVASVTGDVGGKVVGAVASVTGDVGGKVTGSVGSLADKGASLTSVGDTRLANLDATVSSRSTYAGGAVASVTGDVGGKVTGSVGSLADKGASLTSVGDTRLANLDAAVSSRSTYAGGAVASVTGDVGGKVTGSVGSLADKGASLTSVGDTRLANLDVATSTRAAAATALTNATWTDALAAALGKMGAASDPLASPVPGTYAVGQAGYVLGKFLDKAVSAVGSAAGTGASANPITVETAGHLPIAQAEVMLSTDALGINRLWGPLFTNDAGQVTFYLDRGVTYYCWRRKAGWTFTNPYSFVAQ